MADAPWERGEGRKEGILPYRAQRFALSRCSRNVYCICRSRGINNFKRQMPWMHNLIYSSQENNCISEEIEAQRSSVTCYDHVVMRRQGCVLTTVLSCLSKVKEAHLVSPGPRAPTAAETEAWGLLSLPVMLPLPFQTGAAALPDSQGSGSERRSSL